MEKMSIFCRLCAETKIASEIVTSINDPERLVEQKLIACCQWNPQNTDFELPQDVCRFCFNKLENCWSFLQSVQLAQRRIQNMFENETKTRSKINSTKSTKTKFVCNECENSFTSRLALEKHKCHSDESNLNCNICQKTFKTADAHQKHFKKQGKYKCDVCFQLFCSNKALENHKTDCAGIAEEIDVIETKPTFVECDFDYKVTAELLPQPMTGLETEQEKNQDGEPEPEQKLEPEFESEPEHEQKQISFSVNAVGYTMTPLRIQMDIDETLESTRIRNSFPKDDSNRQYYCYLCDRQFKKFPLLRYHMVVHTLPRKYKCQYCNSKFRTERHYTSHQKNHVEYFCETCQKKFPSAFALKVHQRMHIGASVKMYGCEECDHFFVDVSTYYNHMRRRHGLNSAAAKKKAKLIEPNGTAKPYVCEQCGKDFLDRSSLKAHSTVHYDVRPFQCDICPKAFKNKYNLKTHQETHTGEKSVQCTDCGKKYSRKSVLLKHMEEHTGVYTKTFPCDFCDRVFRSLYNMQNHRRTHTGEKPFRCDVCNYDVTTKSQLDRHLKTISHQNKYNEVYGIEDIQDIVQ